MICQIVFDIHSENAAGRPESDAFRNQFLLRKLKKFKTKSF
jgi:hypothetical protein